MGADGPSQVAAATVDDSLYPEVPILVTSARALDPRLAPVWSGCLPPGTNAVTSSDAKVGRPLELRRQPCSVAIAGSSVSLTPREFEILALLVEREGRVLLRPELHALMWSGPFRSRDRSVDVLIRRVRLKLAEIAPEQQFIHTHYGVGYRFEPELA
jgi:DNA-binding response OmpR family regulator